MFRKILVAVDASDYSRQVVPAAIEVAHKFHSNVVVLHVSEHDREAGATTIVGRAVMEFHAAGIEATGEMHEVATGHVARDIADTAMALDSDLIVMGSRGLSDVQGILLGSVTHKVMHLTHTAVLVIRGPLPVKEAATKPTLIRVALVPTV